MIRAPRLVLPRIGDISANDERQSVVLAPVVEKPYMDVVVFVCEPYRSTLVTNLLVEKHEWKTNEQDCQRQEIFSPILLRADSARRCRPNGVVHLYSCCLESNCRARLHEFLSLVGRTTFQLDDLAWTGTAVEPGCF
jgi:hypothetical protein